MAITIGGKRLVSVKELAEWLGKSEGSVHWMIHTKKAPPSAVIGGRRMFTEEGCMEWLEAHFDNDKGAE